MPESVSPQDIKFLRALEEEKKLKRYLYASLERRNRRPAGVTVLPIREFLGTLWSGDYS
ncbi:MAG: hypothetical protein O7B35_07805 [Deltaproteobacteria bacterium]|nr:hypothetical protein [Deltaproteobacteria bacterium]